MKIAPLPGMLAAVLLLAAAASRAEGAPAAETETFHGTVYQIDTISNFVDVITPGGTKRFYDDDATVVRVHRKRAALIDLAMGEEVRGTYRLDRKGARVVVRIDDLTRN